MSREGRKRFKTAKELEKLVGERVLTTEFEGVKPINYNRGELKFKEGDEKKNAGYYLNGIQIQVRSIWKIHNQEIFLDLDYLTRNKIGVTA